MDSNYGIPLDHFEPPILQAIPDSRDPYLRFSMCFGGVPIMKGVPIKKFRSVKIAKTRACLLQLIRKRKEDKEEEKEEKEDEEEHAEEAYYCHPSLCHCSSDPGNESIFGAGVLIATYTLETLTGSRA